MPDDLNFFGAGGVPISAGTANFAFGFATCSHPRRIIFIIFGHGSGGLGTMIKGERSKNGDDFSQM